MRIRSPTPLSTALYRAYYNAWVRSFVVVVILVHLALVFVEPHGNDGEEFATTISRSNVNDTPSLMNRSFDYRNVMYVLLRTSGDLFCLCIAHRRC